LVFIGVNVSLSEIDCQLIEMYGDGGRRDEHSTKWCGERHRTVRQTSVMMIAPVILAHEGWK